MSVQNLLHKELFMNDENCSNQRLQIIVQNNNKVIPVVFRKCHAPTPFTSLFSLHASLLMSLFEKLSRLKEK